MSWVQTLAVVAHVLFAAAIIGLVLLQRGKGADAGAGFGAGASGTVFGARGSGSFLSRTTAVLATLFFVTSLLLSYLFSQNTAPTSVVDRVQTQVPAPSQPPAPAGMLPDVPEAPAGAAPAGTSSAPVPASSGQPAAPASTPASEAPATQGQ
jgi:preprotein translocase subunit SecG